MQDLAVMLREEMERQNLDVFAVDDINDTGNGEPLFSNFEFEDWALLGLRFEVCDARDGAAVIAAARVGLVELHDQAARDVDEQALSSDAAALSLPLQQLTHLLATAGAVSERSMKEHGGT